MQKNHQYLLRCAKLASAETPAARVLDFGCGGGDIVRAGRRDGMRIWGVDVFYEGSRAREIALQEGSLGRTVFGFTDSRLPFRDQSFDVVVSNQVLEHVEDLRASLTEIHRVLRPGGQFISLFPSQEVVPEGHCGIPMVHWLPSGSKARYRYAMAMRCLGFGLHKHEKGRTRREWTKHKLAWLDRFVHYRRREEVLDLFSDHFTLQPRERDYLTYRARHAGGPAGRLAANACDKLLSDRMATRITNRIAGLAVAASRRPDPD